MQTSMQTVLPTDHRPMRRTVLERGAIVIGVTLLVATLTFKSAHAEIISVPLAASSYSLSSTTQDSAIQQIWAQELPSIRASRQALIASVPNANLKEYVALFSASIKSGEYRYYLTAFNYNCQTAAIVPNQRQCLAKLAKMKGDKVISITPATIQRHTPH